MLFLSLFFSSLKAKFDVIRKDRDYYTEATTLEVDFESSVKRVYFRFRGMQDKWNEWVEAESTRIAPHQAYTRAPHLLPKKPAKKADKKADKKDGEKKRSATPTSADADSTDADSTSAPPTPQANQTSVPQNNLQAQLQLLAMREQERRQQQQLRARAEMAQQAQYAQWIAQQRAQQAGAGLQYNQQLQQLQQQQLQQQQIHEHLGRSLGTTGSRQEYELQAFQAFQEERLRAAAARAYSDAARAVAAPRQQVTEQQEMLAQAQAHASIPAHTANSNAGAQLSRPSPPSAGAQPSRSSDSSSEVVRQQQGHLK